VKIQLNTALSKAKHISLNKHHGHWTQSTVRRSEAQQETPKQFTHWLKRNDNHHLISVQQHKSVATHTISELKDPQQAPSILRIKNMPVILPAMEKEKSNDSRRRSSYRQTDIASPVKNY